MMTKNRRFPTVFSRFAIYKTLFVTLNFTP